MCHKKMIRETPQPLADDRTPDMAISDIRNTDVPALIKGPSCTVCILLDELPEDEAQALRELLGDPRWRYTALADALRAEGHNVPDYALSRHGRGQCSAKTKCR